MPREEARNIARLMDAGGEAAASVRRLWETPEGKVVPILLVAVRPGDADPSLEKPAPPKYVGQRALSTPAAAGRGCGSMLTALLLGSGLLVVLAAC